MSVSVPAIRRRRFRCTCGRKFRQRRARLNHQQHSFTHKQESTK